MVNKIQHELENKLINNGYQDITDHNNLEECYNRKSFAKLIDNDTNIIFIFHSVFIKVYINMIHNQFIAKFGYYSDYEEYLEKFLQLKNIENSIGDKK